MSNFTTENDDLNGDPREKVGTGGEIDFTPFQEGMSALQYILTL